MIFCQFLWSSVLCYDYMCFDYMALLHIPLSSFDHVLKWSVLNILVYILVLTIHRRQIDATISRKTTMMRRVNSFKLFASPSFVQNCEALGTRSVLKAIARNDLMNSLFAWRLTRRPHAVCFILCTYIRMLNCSHDLNFRLFAFIVTHRASCR